LGHALVANTQELFLHEPAEIYDAEHSFRLGQEAMVQGALNEVPKRAIKHHIEQTREPVRNVERIFEDLGQEPRREHNEVAEALVKEASERLHETQNSDLHHRAIVSAVTKVERF